MVSILIKVGVIALIVIAVVAFLCSIYRVADVDKALVITGGKDPVIKISGGGFVIPIFRKASYFDLCMLTVSMAFILFVFIFASIPESVMLPVLSGAVWEM